VDASGKITDIGQPPSKLRVAWVAAPQTLDNFAPVLEPLAVGLTDELIELLLICPPKVDTHPLPTPPMDVVRCSRMCGGIFGTGALRALIDEIVSRKVQIIHALDIRAAHLTRKLGRRIDVPYVISSWTRRDGRRLGRLDDRAAAVLAGSEPLRRNLLGSHVADPEKVHLVRPGVHQVQEVGCFADPQRSVAIVAAGPMDRFADFEAVLKSFAELRERRYDCVLMLIGNGRAEKRLRMRTEQLDLQKEVTFVDHQSASRIPAILKGADLFISPVRGGGYGNLSLLGMAAGTPVLTTENGASDFLIDTETALVFQEGKSADLTAKLTALLDNRSAARSLAQNALAHLREHHSPAKMVSEVTKIYRNAVGQ
jgi:glycosyltransferase involved in cell wall biosynthesis